VKYGSEFIIDNKFTFSNPVFQIRLLFVIAHYLLVSQFQILEYIKLILGLILRFISFMPSVLKTTTCVDSRSWSSFMDILSWLNHLWWILVHHLKGWHFEVRWLVLGRGQKVSIEWVLESWIYLLELVDLLLVEWIRLEDVTT